MKDKKGQILECVFNFFVESHDFNGIPLRQIGKDLDIPYEESIDLVKELVSEDKCMIQSSTNPHIIYLRTFPIQPQLECLEAAKELKTEIHRLGDFEWESENTETPTCVYPSQSYLQANRNVSGMPIFTRLLAWGEPQLTPCYFDMEVLQRYYDDPRYLFFIKDYSGRISYREKDGTPIVRKEDEAFLQTFGLGYDNTDTRIVVAFLRYLNELTPEHQNYWHSKMVNPSREPRMLEEYYENTIEGRWVTSESVYTAFQYEMNAVVDLSKQIFGKPLFRDKISLDNPPKELSFFYLPTKKNYNDFVLAMDQMISENINRDFFVDKLSLETEEEREDGMIVVTPKGTLTLLKEWLEQSITMTYGKLDDLLKPFKEIRKLRQEPAHTLTVDEHSTEYFGKQKDLIWKTYCSMRNLRVLLAGHPKADKKLIPDWLDTAEIKNY